MHAHDIYTLRGREKTDEEKEGGGERSLDEGK